MHNMVERPTPLVNSYALHGILPCLPGQTGEVAADKRITPAVGVNVSVLAPAIGGQHLTLTSPRFRLSFTGAAFFIQAALV
jgi:hypothetical protein